MPAMKGWKAARVVVNGGEISLTASDDAVNAAKAKTEEEEAGCTRRKRRRQYGE